MNQDTPIHGTIEPRRGILSGLLAAWWESRCEWPRCLRKARIGASTDTRDWETCAKHCGYVHLRG